LPNLALSNLHSLAVHCSCNEGTLVLP